MALKSNRVGVRTDQVDVYGRITSKSFFQSILDHLPRWTSLKVWKNGTEQLLPVNTDEPVTSPIIADIQYPTDSSATEQMFTYRKSPTEVDGEAYIKSIKGNTIVWNQTFPTKTVNYTGTGYTLTSSNDGKFVITVTETATVDASVNHFNISSDVFKEGHKYYIRGNISNIAVLIKSVTTNMIEKIWVAPNFIGSNVVFTFTDLPVGTYTLYPQAFDLTAMFGSAKADEIYAMETAHAGSGVAYFRSLFPLPYYKYDAGSLLSFNGTGIKTVGFNQWDEDWEKGQYNSATDVVQKINSNNHIRSKNPIPVIPNTTYYFNSAGYNIHLIIADIDDNVVYRTVSMNNNVFTTPANSAYVYFNMSQAYGTEYKDDLCINVSSEKNGTYDSYTTFTTTIPTDTYFPTGMKSVGNTYDEFNSSRAYTRIGEVDLGSITWTYDSQYTRFKSYKSDFPGIKTYSSVRTQPLKCGMYEAITDGRPFAEVPNMSIYNDVGTSVIYIINTSYTDAVSFKTAMDGVMLQYELAEEIIEPTLTFDEE